MKQVHLALHVRLSMIEAMLSTSGISTGEVVKALGCKTHSRPGVLLRRLVAEGRAFATGHTNRSMRFFPTAESRDAYMVAYRAEMAARRLVNNAEANRRYRMGAVIELPTMRVREQDAKEAKQQRDKAEKRKTQTRLKKETKAAGSLVFKTGTDIARPKKVPWSEMPVQNPNGVEPTKYESQLQDRFAVKVAPSVVSSRECRPWAQAVAA